MAFAYLLVLFSLFDFSQKSVNFDPSFQTVLLYQLGQMNGLVTTCRSTCKFSSRSILTIWPRTVVGDILSSTFYHMIDFDAQQYKILFVVGNWEFYPSQQA